MVEMIKKMLPLLLLLLETGGCRASGCAAPEAFTQKVNEELKTAKPFRLDKLTNFTWDHLHIIAPYTPISVAARQSGTNERELSSSEIERSDMVSLLVFVQGGRLARCMDFPRHLGDFSVVASDVGAPNTGSFVGQIAGDGSV